MRMLRLSAWVSSVRDLVTFSYLARTKLLLA